MTLNDKALDLAESIKKTREFLELKYAQNEIAKDPELKNKVEEFKRTQQQILSASKPVKETEAQMLKLMTNFNSLSKIPEVNRYLAAGKNFNYMMVNLFKTINDSIEKDLNP